MTDSLVGQTFPMFSHAPAWQPTIMQVISDQEGYVECRSLDLTRTIRMNRQAAQELIRIKFTNEQEAQS
ncbi:MAG: hypothetical protein Q7O66_07220 [Dehalococcoidia bacterium]|nr:hypothetical protein [Dehalococcoidia bacterium]